MLLAKLSGDLIKRPLDHIEDLVLDHAGFGYDGDNDVAFGYLPYLI